MTKPEAVTQEAREIAQKIVDDASLRWACLKPLYDSVDLGDALIKAAIQAAEQRGMERAADICAHWAEKYAAASDSAIVAKKRVEARDFESMGMACRFREHDIRQAIRQGEQA